MDRLGLNPGSSTLHYRWNFATQMGAGEGGSSCASVSPSHREISSTSFTELLWSCIRKMLRRMPGTQVVKFSYYLAVHLAANHKHFF